jgi:RNA ligase
MNLRQNEQQQHPARAMSFDELMAGLEAARSDLAVYNKSDGNGLEIWGYTNRCVYEKLWGTFSLIARGLILEPAQKRVVATPFPKFFNLGERQQDIPDLPFEALEKVDGSLIIIFHHNGAWRTSTRGAFETSQAIWAHQQLSELNLGALTPGYTYLAEAVYAENRIVISYDKEELVLLSAYDNEGFELRSDQLLEVSSKVGMRMADRHAFTSIKDAAEKAMLLPQQEEGYVLRFSNGLRLKLKGLAYTRIHALISRVTPLAIWEMFRANDDLDQIRHDIPEEYWKDFDAIRSILENLKSETLNQVRAFAGVSAHLSDKEIGLQLGQLHPVVRKFIFKYRKLGDELLKEDKTREMFWLHFRPTGNDLPGYVPSNELQKILSNQG